MGPLVPLPLLYLAAMVAAAAVPANNNGQTTGVRASLERNYTATLHGHSHAGTLVGAAAGSRPHIVYILCDNLGYGGVGFLRAASPTGPSREVVTPNIDALAATGVQLRRFYCYKFCSPSRSVAVPSAAPAQHPDNTLTVSSMPSTLTLP